MLLLLVSSVLCVQMSNWLEAAGRFLVVFYLGLRAWWSQSTKKAKVVASKLGLKNSQDITSTTFLLSKQVTRCPDSRDEEIGSSA